MHAEIIAIGDEIVSGEHLDTNSPWLSRRLEELGIRVLYHSTAGDELQACEEVFRNAMCRADIVISTGGLGPTVDDPTREAVAKAAEVETEIREELWEQVVATISKSIPGAVPCGLAIIRLPAGNIAWISFCRGISRFRRANNERICSRAWG